MISGDISPLTVVKYHRDFLIELVRYFTGWSQRSEVSVKPQLKYLCNYLEVDHIDAKTIVVENEYIDRHYLEDYSEYYARCFSSHPRKSVRVHFFSNEFTEQDFTAAYIKNNQTFIGELQNSYLGFAVFRPIPHTFLARVCLKPYGQFLNSNNHKLIKSPIKVSLFGIPLQVETTAFIEQDKVVSACATSALWTLLGASSLMSSNNLPSPSAITKIAANSSSEGMRTFPSPGLTHTQVARTLKHYGLEPSILEIQNKDFSELKEFIYAYISNDTPILIGGDVYKHTNTKDHESLGRHLVCSLGYHFGNENWDKGGFKLRSHAIDKIYVHDDRYGPFIKIDTTPVNFNILSPAESGAQNVTKTGLELSLHKEKSEIFVPEIAIIGLYHKIRIPYKNVKDLCQALHTYLSILREILTPENEDLEYKDQADQEYYEPIINALRGFVDGVWDIQLTTNTRIKEELLVNKLFQTFNGSSNKTSFLMHSMPKYIWRCRLLDSKTQVESTDILFDATEVPQGRVMIGYVSYSIEAETMWRQIENHFKERFLDKLNLDDKHKNHISAFSRYFNESDKTLLNTLYGPLGLPRRKLKEGEQDQNENINQRKDVSIIRSGNWDWTKLDPETRYIWLINEYGDLVLGEDIENDKEGFLGHPTLVDGKPARIGGELLYSKESQRWEVNLKSGAYSGHITHNSIEARSYLNNVIKNNFKGLKRVRRMKEVLQPVSQ